MIRLLIFFAFVIAALLGCLVAVKENGATDHPLLVDSAAPSMPPMRLFTVCQPARRNAPILEERSA